MGTASKVPESLVRRLTVSLDSIGTAVVQDEIGPISAGSDNDSPRLDSLALQAASKAPLKLPTLLDKKPGHGYAALAEVICYSW